MISVNEWSICSAKCCTLYLYFNARVILYIKCNFNLSHVWLIICRFLSELYAGECKNISQIIFVMLTNCYI